MTTLTATLEDPLLVRVRELRTMIEDPAADNTGRQNLTRGYFRLIRHLKARGVNFYAQPAARGCAGNHYSGVVLRAVAAGGTAEDAEC